METTNFLTRKLHEYGELAFDFVPKVIGGLLILWIGWKVIHKLHGIIAKVFERINISPALRPFLLSMSDLALKIFLFLTVAGIIGFNTSSLMALVAAMGFAIGMAMQGSLANFAAGILVLIFKPYEVGDMVEMDGYTGFVKEIQIFNTLIVTIDGRNVIVPNSKASSDTIVNHSTDGNIRVDVFTYIPYEENFGKIRKILLEALANHPKIMHKEGKTVEIESYESHSIKIGVFVYCDPLDYWTVYYSVNETIKETFAANDVKVAYSEGVELGKIG